SAETPPPEPLIVAPPPPPPPIVESAPPPSPAPAPPPSRAPLPALADLRPREPETMDAHVARLLQLLNAGEIDAALTAERTWREEHDGDDCRRSSPFAAARWLLVRELVGVAARLPAPILSALVDALAASDLSNARAAL